MWGNLPPDHRAIHALAGVYGRVHITTELRQKGTPHRVPFLLFATALSDAG